jgi:hypothetical protein
VTIHLPMEPSGRRLTLAEACRQRGRPLHQASAVPFEVNIHLHWAGVATDRRCTSDRSLESST